ncbi:BMP family ABC transporter substrate-binding protein [Catellatospora chokoriensis]|nr:BMP family ABC transporter substrate-binding protein [Catellatospora chokoriensis]
MKNWLEAVVRSGLVATQTRRGMTRARWCALGVGAAVLVAGVTWALWPEAEGPNSRQYRDVVACMLTDDKGLNSPDAALVWSGMQEASVQTLVRVQYLTVDGEQTVENARGYLNSQVQSRCTMVFAVGEAPRAAVRDNASAHADVRFVVFAAALSDEKANVSVLELSRAAVRTAVIDETGAGQQ